MEVAMKRKRLLSRHLGLPLCLNTEFTHAVTDSLIGEHKLSMNSDGVEQNEVEYHSKHGVLK
eukprot:2236348-Amphidinium_carterae.1